METTERIVEAYMRYIKHCMTIPNLRCKGQYEIDLLAMSPSTGERFHIETTVSISKGFRKLTDLAFDPELLKKRVHTARQRRTVGYFADRKFKAPELLDTLAGYGFKEGNYAKVIVTWEWTSGALAQATQAEITVWSIKALMNEIAEEFRSTNHYFTDDTLRTLYLYDQANRAQVGHDRTPQ